ncbi:MAG TPA: hypothetical protein VJ742_13305 [Nitrososphaera sp.]|nr:hypothetical protein [Nitrososphaera sp.]
MKFDEQGQAKVRYNCRFSGRYDFLRYADDEYKKEYFEILNWFRDNLPDGLIYESDGDYADLFVQFQQYKDQYKYVVSIPSLPQHELVKQGITLAQWIEKLQEWADKYGSDTRITSGFMGGQYFRREADMSKEAIAKLKRLEELGKIELEAQQKLTQEVRKKRLLEQVADLGYEVKAKE